MARNISFQMTTEQVRARTKTVTRRLGWTFLKIGEELNAIKKGQGLKKGERVERLGRIRVVGVRRERLDAITFEDVEREGFADHPMVMGFPSAFVEMFCASHRGCKPETTVTRIEFEYLD